MSRQVLAKVIGRRPSTAGATVLAAGVVAAISIWSFPASSSKVAVASPDAAANRLAAESDAASLLASLPLPSGATQSTIEPSGDGSALAQPGSGPPATPNVVDDSSWWLVPGTPHAVLAYINAHLPAVSSQILTGSGKAGADRTSIQIEVFAWPPITNVLGTRWLTLKVVQLPGGSTGLRADAQVVWVTPRPAAERIPSGVHSLRISVRSTIPANKPKQGPLTITSPKRVHRIVSLLNALPATQPGVKVCPNDSGVRVRLAFYARHGVVPLAVALVNPGGCGDVQLTIGGRQQPSLEGEGLPGLGTSPRASLIRRLDSALGVKLHVNPS